MEKDLNDMAKKDYRKPQDSDFVGKTITKARTTAIGFIWLQFEDGTRIRIQPSKVGNGILDLVVSNEEPE